MKMDLTCSENIVPDSKLDMNCAEIDKTMIKDPRVIVNLLLSERSTTIQFDYFKHIQREITPYMRGVVASWMMEVCDEQHCEGQVFPLAINYLDRFLCVCSISRQQFQLLGATCLLLASKIRQCRILSADLLSAYTDFSATPGQIRTFELLLLTKLQWNLSAITGFDYIDHLIERLHWGHESTTRIRQHAHTLVTVCIIDLKFMQTLPSVLASACICSAARGLRMPSAKNVLRDICRITKIDPVEVEYAVLNIEMVIARENEAILKQQQENQSFKANQQYNSNNTNNTQLHGKLSSDGDLGQPETPTDIQDVYF